MKGSKYIVSRNLFGPSMFIFPLTVKHNEMADSLKLTEEDIMSAGFVDTCEVSKHVYCHGESISLGITANPDVDNKIVKFMLGLE